MITKKTRKINKLKFIIVAFFLLLQCSIVGQTISVSYQAALDMADKSNPDIIAAKSVINETQYRKQQISANLLPQADASATYTRYGETPPSKKYLIGDSKNDIYSDITLKQVIYSGGRYKNQLLSVDKQMSIDQEKLEQIRRNVRLSTARAWLEALRSKYVIQLQVDLIKNMNTQLSIAQLLYSSGKVSELDILRYQTQINSAQGQLQTLQSNYSTKLIALAQAIGTVDSLSIEDISLPELDELEAWMMSESALAELISDLPEIKSNYLKIDKSRIDQRIIRSDYYPTISAKFGMSVEDSSIFPGNLSWNAGLVISVPLFRGGSTKAQLAQSNERIFQAMQALESTAVSLTSRIRTALETVREKHDRIAIIQKTLSTAEQTISVAELRYTSGKLSAFELIDAQNMLAQTQKDLFNAQVDYRIALEEIASMFYTFSDTKE